ncbi:hypothetical protein BGW36DRAFT_428012 [Talaromyces proteolyticus]|uniref:Bactericidal permeability-increasing protein n=1 Tax=Talaromyces proteolyticus TaxID=1131652 RepID=A0AAD4KP51_9EURO|nr:uncharacterized protein BGW36DRAFT_428012 [Talaromyces proteolyticus]KAH8695988.1 hypothetical protein BGW36DRAFT_428012 [Talaromyces proteolyticus]
MSSCCGRRKPQRSRDADTEPLLPIYEDETARQRQLHQKLHSYQMFKALSEGYMPSTEQVIANLRTLLASDVLNPRVEDLSDSGRQLARDVKIFFRVFIELLREKNNDDQLQEFLWYLSKSRASLDTPKLVSQASRAKGDADMRAAYDSLRTVGNLLLTNADFRLFLDDIATVGRQVFADTSHSVSEAAHQVAEVAEPSREEMSKVKGAGADEGKHPSKDDLRGELNLITATAEEGIADAGKTAKKSAEEHLSGEYRDALLHRLKQTVLKLRNRDDYSDSVSTLSKLVQRYGLIYSNAAENTVNAIDEDIDINADLKNAVDRFWVFVRSFGDVEEWKLLEERFHNVMRHSSKDPEFESLISSLGASLQEMLIDPKFFDSASERLDELTKMTKNVGSETTLRADIDAFLHQTRRALRAIREDAPLVKLVAATKKIYHNLSNVYNDRTSTLVADVAHVFLPLLVRSIQHIPIPRLEISIPEMDLLVENLVLEPGRTVNQSSFFPFKVLVSSKTDMELAKVHSKKAHTNMKTIITVSLKGLNISASEFGYWIRAHSGLLFRFGDEGIGSFFLDERGIDVSIDLEIGKDRLAHLVTLRGVRVHVHKLDYKIKRSRWKTLLWLVKPFLKQLIRRSLEKKIAEFVVSMVVTINRELVFARERLRAVNIANPPDYATFIRALLARPQAGVFKGIYAPGSIVKVWKEEAEQAQEAIERGDESSGLHLTWRNEIFDVNATTLS